MKTKRSLYRLQSNSKWEEEGVEKPQPLNSHFERDNTRGIERLTIVVSLREGRK